MPSRSSKTSSILVATLEREKQAIFNTGSSTAAQHRLWSRRKAEVEAYLASDDAAEDVQTQQSSLQGASYASHQRKRPHQPFEFTASQHPEIHSTMFSSVSTPPDVTSISDTNVRSTPLTINHPSGSSQVASNQYDSNAEVYGLFDEVVLDPDVWLARNQTTDTIASKRQRLNDGVVAPLPHLSTSTMTDQLGSSNSFLMPTPISSASSGMSASSYHSSPSSSYHSSFCGGEDMSRQGSSVSSTSMTHGFGMMRVESTGVSDPNSSFPFPFEQEQDSASVLSHSIASCKTERPGRASSMHATPMVENYDSQQSDFLKSVGCAFGSENSFCSPEIVSATNIAGNGMPWHVASTDTNINNTSYAPFMERSETQASNTSSSSSSSRAAQQKASARQRKHVANAAAQSLRPKSSVSTPEKAAPKALTPQKKAIPRLSPEPKTTSSKPCKICGISLKGQHEFHRHWSSVHAPLKKVWICVEPASSPIKPESTLSICGRCKNNKHYNAYYNAAEHLRRAHFTPKKRNRKPKGEPKALVPPCGKTQGLSKEWPKDHRGPSIEWLKEHGWLKEITVENKGELVVDDDLAGEICDEEDIREQSEISNNAPTIQVAFDQSLSHPAITQEWQTPPAQLLNSHHEALCTQELGLQAGFPIGNDDYSLLDAANNGWMMSPAMEHCSSAPGRMVVRQGWLAGGNVEGVGF